MFSRHNRRLITASDQKRETVPSGKAERFFSVRDLDKWFRPGIADTGTAAPRTVTGYEMWVCFAKPALSLSGHEQGHDFPIDLKNLTEPNRRLKSAFGEFSSALSRIHCETKFTSADCYTCVTPFQVRRRPAPVFSVHVEGQSRPRHS